MGQYTFFVFKQKTAYEIRLSIVGSEMCIRGHPKRRSLLVTPFIGIAHSPLKLKAKVSEIAAIFDAPLSTFMDTDQYQYFEMKSPVGSLSFPYLTYKGYKIWGFTLKVLVDMLNATLDAGIDLKYPSDAYIEELRKRGQQ